MKFATASTLIPLLLAAVSAEKDTTYYANGIVNPNIEGQKMYWHEGSNVLEDLTQFDKLYVSYHSCAWETPTGGEEGEGAGEDDSWYLGAVPSHRANVAFSLYGILKGERDMGCKKKTFINSFHTTQGVESFTNAMAAAGLTNLFDLVDEEEDNNDDSTAITSYCYEDEDGENDGDDSVVNGDKLYGGSSYGVGCAAPVSKKSSASFAIHTYGGGTCDANEIVGTLDTLGDFNARLGSAICVPIYTEGDYYGGDDDEDASSPLTLLENSRACRIYDGTGSCPDPYGKLKQYENALQQALSGESGPWFTAHRVMAMAWTFIAFGIFTFLAGLTVVALDMWSPKTTLAKTAAKGGDDDDVEDAKALDRSPSHVSKALSAVSQFSKAASKSIGLSGGDDGSKKSKKSSRSNKSRSSKSTRSIKSQKSAKSQRSTRSNVSKDSHMSNQVDKQIVMQHQGSHESKLSAEDEAIDLAASKDERSVHSAAEDLVTFIKSKSQELFQDENNADDDDDQSVEIRVPQSTLDALPYSAPGAIVDPNEMEVTVNDETNSKKKYRKRRWFKKILGTD